MIDDYLYNGTGVLKNLFNVRTQSELDDIEADYVSLRLKELVENPLPGHYDLRHFLEFHRFIFQDVYPWAGETRHLNIYKEEPVLGGLSVEYSDFHNIKEDLIATLNRFNEIDWGSKIIPEISKEFAELVAALWKIHPFREGNTRTTITFCCQFADSHGFPIKRDIFEKNSLYVRTSMVAYNAVFKDIGDHSSKQYLEKIVLDALS